MYYCPRCDREVNIDFAARAFVCPRPPIIDCLVKEHWYDFWKERPMTDRDPLLQEREKTHGSFERNAQYWHALLMIAPLPRENKTQIAALSMIYMKLARILSGQADFKDHWKDLSGYALLAMEACNEDKNPR